MTLLFGLFLLQGASLYAQDPMKASPNVYKKVLLENDKVRVMEVEFKPGTAVAWHSHPNHVIYALTNGKIEITEKGKSASSMDIKAGTALYMPAVTHMAKNVGTTTIKLIVTEMKPMMQKKMNSMMPAAKKK
ncbi:cupin domain-containing protein [Flavobacterium sp.]|uniref:cupin domain-containing protein n=1 Tax=Flavobacterium sp. TaxID=239 RepID=UPI001B460B26|nr:cupin domain-containing protein [Flavobacterium sp.]MBP6180374.1 cupin domain-containing protein [Flavobacterium sp.]